MNKPPAFLALWLLVTPAALADDWPQFRGPDGQGHSHSRYAPIAWSEQENITWRAEIPGLGWSSPVVAGEQIWLTTALEDQGSLRAICLDRRTGRLLHDVEVFRLPDVGRINARNSHASPTPVIDGTRVFVHFGGHGTACLSTGGRVLWKTQALKHDHAHGPAGSPIVWNDLLVISADGFDQQFIAALDKNTGQLSWRQDRPGPMGYSTPLAIRTPAMEQIVSVGGGIVAAYAPRSGAEVWRFRFDGYSVVPRPVLAGDKVLVCSGYETPSLYAIRTDGSGEVTSSHLAWAHRRGVPHVSSPLVVGQEVYLVSNNGVLTCLDIQTGQELWRKRLGGQFSASPVHAAGRIYLLDENGTTHVLNAGRRFELVAKNVLDGRSLASPAICGGSIFLRTERALYRIDDPAAQGVIHAGYTE